MESDPIDPTERVRRSYDRLGPRFADARSPTYGLSFLDRVTAGLAPGARVLDVGCGPGVPLTRALVDRGFVVTGVDLSAEQLRIAARRVPEAMLRLGDICELHWEPDTFDAIVAWDSVFHVPRDRHLGLFAKFARWLRPGGRLLLTAGGSAGEFVDRMLGEEFFYSGEAPERVEGMLVAGGFATVERVAEDPAGRGHVVFLAGV